MESLREITPAYKISFLNYFLYGNSIQAKILSASDILWKRTISNHHSHEHSNKMG